MPKKILIFSLAYYPNYVSGAEVAIKEITDRIPPDEFEFHVLTLRFDKKQPREEKLGNAMVHRLGVGPAYLSKILFIPLAALFAARFHKKYRADALWATMSYMVFPIALMRLCFVKIPYVLTLQDGDPYEKVFKRWFIRIVSPLLNAGFRNASVVQAISKYLAEWAPRRGYKGPVEIIYNGANARDFTEKYSKEELDDFKKKTGKKEGDIFMVTTSRLSHKNGIDTVIRAMPLLPENVYFLVVGGGEDEKMLKDLAKELNVEKRVVFVGQVDRTETPKYRRISEIFVRPSRSEGFGNSFASAMAAKIPVIATQEGGIAEFLFDAKRNPDKPATGWAVDKDNPGQIAEAVKDILSNPEKVKKTTETAYKMTYEKYNWDSIAKDMKERIFYVLVKNSG